MFAMSVCYYHRAVVSFYSIIKLLSFIVVYSRGDCIGVSYHYRRYYTESAHTKTEAHKMKEYNTIYTSAVAYTCN